MVLDDASRPLISGDVIFGRGGRSDFPRGDHAAADCGYHGKPLPLGDDVTFIPGYGPLSTLGEGTAVTYLGFCRMRCRSGNRHDANTWEARIRGLFLYTEYYRLQYGDDGFSYSGAILSGVIPATLIRPEATA
ncbi:hypothetical protein LN650_21375 [Klebsiella pneumoniae subsp. pneumoniae]|nr:hypothetical protein [Klebsiella pneumoniae subsp. pneumoniae]